MRPTHRRRIVVFALVATGLLVCAPAVAQPGRLFDYQSVQLSNGLRVITLEDFSCPIVAVHLWYHVGSKDEDPQRQGFAHMFEHMMFRGTDRLGPTDHFDLIRRTGGNCNAYTSFDQTVYVQTLPANQLELALWLEAERMSFLKIDQDAFDTERKVVEEERRLGLNRPYGTLVEQILAELFHEHPYRWSTIGKIPHLRAAAVPELRDFWTRFYVPNNATLVIVGAVRHADAQRLAERYFGWIPRCPDPPRIAIREPLPEQARSVTLKEDNAPAPLLGVLYRTVPAGHDDAVPLQLLATILGGGQSSRLYRELVADKQIAVFAGAGAIAMEQDGLFVSGAALAPFGGDADAVLAAIDAQIERLRREPVSERELTKARNQMLRDLVTDNLTVVSKASALGSAAVLEGDVERVNRRLEAVQRAAADDLLRVANEYLQPQRALRGKVERNLLGSLGGMLGVKKGAEDAAPITAQPETQPPPPGRPGLARPDDFPAAPPVADMLPHDPTPRFVASTLANGLKVLVVENHEVPFVTVQLGLRPGAWTEDKPGTASMALSMLTRGTAAHSEAELADEMETYAISIGGGADLDSSSVTATCLTEQTERAVRLLAEVVRTPTFPDEEFEKLRKQVRTALAVQTNEPSYKADRELRRRLYGAHPYARTPTGELSDLDALGARDAREWWSRFARPDMATLIFAGDIDPQRAAALAGEAFGDWAADGPVPRVETPPIPEPQPTHIYLVDHPGVQSQIRVARIGITRTDPGYFVSRVVSGYFGGAFSSRLNEAIRVKRGLTYGAGGGFSAQRMAGELTIHTFTKNESVGDALRAVFEELERLRTDPPSDDELSRTRSYILGSFPAQRETPQQVAAELWQIESNDLPADFSQRLLAGVARTTAADCTALVSRTVDTSRLVVVVVGPAEAIREQLEAIAPVTVVSASDTTQ